MNRLVWALLLAWSSVWWSGCAVRYTIQPPTTSTARYDAPREISYVLFTDDRNDHTLFSDGRPPVQLTFAEGNGELAYLQKHVLEALRARGVRVAAAGSPGAGDLTAHVRSFGIRNQRMSSFSPMVTFTRFSADVQRGAAEARIAVYTKQSKNAVWSMSELREPCFNRPMHIVVGEIAAKINRHFIGGRIGAAQLNALVARVAEARGPALLQVINELGWSNEPDALRTLTALSRSEQEEVRGAALGAIGTLGVASSFAQLQLDAVHGKTHTDRYMALKAIGDLDTAESLAYLRDLEQKLPDTAEGVATREILKLYLDGRAPAVAEEALTPISAADGRGRAP